MRVYDGSVYRDATPEEIAKNEAFDEEMRRLPPTDADKAEAYDILMGVSE